VRVKTFCSCFCGFFAFEPPLSPSFHPQSVRSDFSLAERRAYSIQSVLRPDYRPPLGEALGAVTGSRRLSSAVQIRLSFFFFPTFPGLSQRNFKPGSSRNDDGQLHRSLASPVLWRALHSRPRRLSLFGYCVVVRTPLHSPTACESVRPASSRPRPQLVSSHFSLRDRRA
jgi:hypothetical protein